jgi:hypothetical protein
LDENLRRGKSKMAYILNKSYDPSTFPGPTIRRPPYYDLGPSVQIPNAPFYPQAFDSKWHADVSGLGDWRFPWTWGWLKNAFKGGTTEGQGGLKLPGGTILPGNFILDGGFWYQILSDGTKRKIAAEGSASLSDPGRYGQGWLAKIFGGIGGGLKNLFSMLQQGGGGGGTEPEPEPEPGGGTNGGTGTDKKQTIAGLDPNILLVIGALAIGGLFIVMSRPTSSGQPQIIMPEMFRPRKTYARRRAAPARRTTVKRRRR